MNLAEKDYYTATVEHWSIDGQQSLEVQSGSLRQCMRSAARFNVSHPYEAEIHIYWHQSGHEPKRVAWRRVVDRRWTYVKDN